VSAILAATQTKDPLLAGFCSCANYLFWFSFFIILVLPRTMVDTLNTYLYKEHRGMATPLLDGCQSA